MSSLAPQEPVSSNVTEAAFKITTSKKRRRDETEEDEVIVDRHGVIYIDCSPAPSDREPSAASYSSKSYTWVTVDSTMRRKLRGESPDWTARPQFKKGIVPSKDPRVLNWLEGHPSQVPNGHDHPYHQRIARMVPAHLRKDRSDKTPVLGRTQSSLSTSTSSNRSFKLAKPGGVRVSSWNIIKQMVQQEMDAEAAEGKDRAQICVDARRKLDEIREEIARVARGVDEDKQVEEIEREREATSISAVAIKEQRRENRYLINATCDTRERLFNLLGGTRDFYALVNAF